MYFGIRGKVALLVMLATAASALLVAKVLSHRAEAVLRDHELVDLGDEASLRGWELIDQIEGLRADVLSVANDENFRKNFEAGMSKEELLVMARGLCKRHWKSHVRIDLVTFVEGKPQSLILASSAELPKSTPWLPGPEAGDRARLSKVQRQYLKRTDLPEGLSSEGWEPVVWAMAPLGLEGPSASYIRIMMTLKHTRSPRHFFVLQDSSSNFLVRYDESAESLENDAVFKSLNENEDLKKALKRSRDRNSDPEEVEEEPKIVRLARQEKVDLAESYFFQEATPDKEFTKALMADDPDALEIFIEELRLKYGHLGNFGGLSTQAGEIRFLVQTEENLAQLRDAVSTALENRYQDTYDGLVWRGQVECDQINVWSVRLLVGSAAAPDEYILHYAVLDDELASSIAYEMLSLQTIAIFVAAGFGFIGFLIAMHFIRPLRKMTRTAQKITESQREGFHQQVADLARDLDTRRQDEVGDIARASKRLFEELISFQEELENRVNDRTRELRRANTELEKAYEKLMSLSHEKDAFVAKVSHDLRQPLNAIFLQVEALRLSNLDDGQVKDVDRIQAHAARELNLVNDILEYQKIIMGAETFSKDTIEVPALLQDLEESFAPGAKDKGLTFTHLSHKEADSLVADERRVRQVLGNLIGNSCKFTTEGTIAVEARPREINEEPWIEFTISDTGRGMSPEEQAKAFVPFVSNKKDNAGGSGLGLSICKELVTQMGGKIGFVSELGKGTHFSVFLPCVPTSEHYEPRETSSSPPVALPSSTFDDQTQAITKDATILIIDDDQKVREMLSRMLIAKGYKVIAARDGREGLKMAAEHLPDAITLDVVMPGGMDGWEVLNELKGSAETQSIPVIMVSVMAEQEHSGTLEVEDYLVKPIDMNRLNRVILRVTGQSPSQNLLLVDDDTDSLTAMSRILEEAGWKTMQAQDGAEALKLLEKTRPAAIVLDLLMPVMDGFEFLEKMQAKEHLRSIPVIVLSGKDTSESEQEFLRERVTLVLKKGQKAASELVETINARIQMRDQDA